MWDFTMKIFLSKKSEIGHGGCTQNWILRTTTMTEFSKTLLVFYKWPDLTDVQGISCTTGVAYLLGRVPGSNPSVWLSRYTIPVLEYQHPGETLASIRYKI
jgi:hypothetical protein